MCIAIITTEHPQYPFILLSNRDEYLHRPTAPAQWWQAPNSHILGGYDLHRSVHGTWLGITRQGRIAVLTNYREEDESFIQGARSRGEIVNAFLTTRPESDESTEEAAGRLMKDGVSGIGGFSLIFGSLRDVFRSEGEESLDGKESKKGLALISNRTPDVKDLVWIAGGTSGETEALSNSWYGDRSWPKVTDGERLVKEAIAASLAAGETKEELLERFFHTMSDDRLPEWEKGDSWEVFTRQLRHSIFIPRVGASTLNKPLHTELKESTEKTHGQIEAEATSGEYGTQKQSIILVDREGNVTYIERSLYDDDGKPIEKGSGDKVFEFKIEGW